MRKVRLVHLTIVSVLLGSLAFDAQVQAQESGIFADFQTSRGNFTVRLEPSLAPKAVANFIGLATGEQPWIDPTSGSVRTNAFFDGLAIERVEPGVLIESGLRQNSASTAPGYWLLPEPSLKFDGPMLAMADDGTNAHGARFFILLTNKPPVQQARTIFGTVTTSGRSVVETISTVDHDSNGTPTTDARIRRVEIRRVGAEAVAFNHRTQGLPAALHPGMSIHTGSNQVVLSFARPHGAVNRLYASTNLLTWNLRFHSPSDELQTAETVIEDIAATSQFFQLAQVRYAERTQAPAILENGPMPAGWSGHPYQLDLNATGGEGPFTWRLVSGALPPEFTITSEGAIVGSTRASGNFTFAVEARDVAGHVTSAALNLPVVPVNPEGLEAYWSLDGDWKDATGRHLLKPLPQGGFVPAPELRQYGNMAFSTLRSATNNGASDYQFTTLPEEDGISMEGWVWLEDDSASGRLFGFGDGSWETAKCSLDISFGFIWLSFGAGPDGATVQYPRIGDTCWHHVCLVLPKGFRSGIPFRLYLDGVPASPVDVNYSATGTNSLNGSASLFGGAFSIAMFAPQLRADDSFSHMRVDDVRVWRRELADTEVALLATSTGEGDLCLNHPPPNWAPGPRFVAPDARPSPSLDLGIHVLTDNTIAIITDPNPWLKSRLIADCGNFLRAMEANRKWVPNWAADRHYAYAASEVILYYRPTILASLSASNHFALSGTGTTPIPLAVNSLWPQCTREFRAPSLAPEGGEVHTYASENVYYSFVTLPFHMQQGRQYELADGWGDRVRWTYDETQTVSWALKVNQVGYLPDAPGKFAYLGSWMGPSNALDVTPYINAPFVVCRESDGQPVYTNTITFRKDDTQPCYDHDVMVYLSGEQVCQLDFSTVSDPGRYYIRVPGIGRSWAFEIGQNAMGEAFYTHARGLYHQRCAPLDPLFTAWPRGDAHNQFYQAAFPTLFDEFSDHSADGWGFLDADGNVGFLGGWPAGEFVTITATKTTEPLTGIIGGWHDAADFDQPNEGHLYGVRDLVAAYLMYPENFSDSQLNIPESGNGIPDVLDEAAWGIKSCFTSQKDDGRVALWINSDAPALSLDAGKDASPYYLGLATRNSSLQYARTSAQLARGLRLAGATNESTRFLASAVRAYNFGVSTFDQFPRVSVDMTLSGKSVKWIEPPTPSNDAKVKALIQLWLATEDPAYYQALNTPDMSEAFRLMCLFLPWLTQPFELMDVAMEPDRFPPGWGEEARTTLIQSANEWLEWMEADAYRHLWYPPGVSYFLLNGLGRAGFDHVRNLIAAWRLTGDPRFRTGALLAVDWMHGANPQGRVYTTGLGQNHTLYPLHAPSDVDGVEDPAPGITIYGPCAGVCWGARTWVYGLFDNRDSSFDFSGSTLAQLPPPWTDTNMSVTAVGDVLTASIPIWRSLTNLERTNPGQMEFTVHETIAEATAVTGCLMGPGWMPSAELKRRQPKTREQLRDSLWFHP